MPSVLLVIIYAAFISLGLPDAMLGAAWPAVQQTFGVPFSFAGILQFIISGCTIVSSFLAGKMLARFGCGRVTAVSVVMTAAALFGFAFSKSFYFLLAAALPLGLGAGSIDAGLNAFVAEHYESRHMSWLHSFWGIGALSGPLVLSALLAEGSSWRYGYLSIAGMQSVLSLILFAALPLWQKVTGMKRTAKAADDERTFETEEHEGRKNAAGERCCLPDAEHTAPAQLNESAGEVRSFSYAELIRTPGVLSAVISFLLYCSAEASTGLWGSSFLVRVKGFEPSRAASVVSLFYVGITAGRIASGFLTPKIRNINLIRIGVLTAAAGFILMLLPLPLWCAPLAFVIAGLGCAPVFPCMIHETPVRFGSAKSPSVIGMQMALAYTGVTFMPPLFGFLSVKIGLAVLPVFLLSYTVLLLLLAERLRKLSPRGDQAGNR